MIAISVENQRKFNFEHKPVKTFANGGLMQATNVSQMEKKFWTRQFAITGDSLASESLVVINCN